MSIFGSYGSVYFGQGQVTVRLIGDCARMDAAHRRRFALLEEKSMGMSSQDNLYALTAMGRQTDQIFLGVPIRSQCGC